MSRPSFQQTNDIVANSCVHPQTLEPSMWSRSMRYKGNFFFNCLFIVGYLAALTKNSLVTQQSTYVSLKYERNDTDNNFTTNYFLTLVCLAALLVACDRSHHDRIQGLPPAMVTAFRVPSHMIVCQLSGVKKNLQSINCYRYNGDKVEKRPSNAACIRIQIQQAPTLWCENLLAVLDS